MSSFAQWFPTLLQTSGTLSHGLGQARTARLNADILRARAREERSAGARDEEALRREARMRIGRQAAAQAQAGVGSTGSAGLMLEQSSILAELDALNIRYGSDMRARGLLAESSALRERSRSARRSAYLLAGAQLLSGMPTG